MNAESMNEHISDELSDADLMQVVGGSTTTTTAISSDNALSLWQTANASPTSPAGEFQSAVKSYAAVQGSGIVPKNVINELLQGMIQCNQIATTNSDGTAGPMQYQFTGTFFNANKPVPYSGVLVADPNDVTTQPPPKYFEVEPGIFVTPE